MFLKSKANRVWIGLLLATGATYWLGESGMSGQAGIQAVFIMLGLAFLKGFWIVADFMELWHAPRKWLYAVLGWLLFVLGMIVLAYWLGLRS